MRVRRVLAALAPASLLAGCIQYGAGVATLPVRDGWQPLPVASWVLNRDIEPEAVVYCPPASCALPAVAMLFSAEGEMAERLAANLADSRKLAERRPRREPAKAKAKPGEKPAPPRSEPPKVTASTIIERGQIDGADLTEVSLLPDRPEGRRAFVAVLGWKDGARQRYALATAADRAAALDFARKAMAAWK